jgi:hypothetical protein
MTTIRLTFFSLMYSATASIVRSLRVAGGTSSSTGTEDSLPILRHQGFAACDFWCLSRLLRPMIARSRRPNRLWDENAALILMLELKEGGR